MGHARRADARKAIKLECDDARPAPGYSSAYFRNSLSRVMHRLLFAIKMIVNNLCITLGNSMPGRSLNRNA